MVDSLRERIAEGLRERTAEDLSERLALLIKERFESAQRERLGGAVRDALAEQIAWVEDSIPTISRKPSVTGSPITCAIPSRTGFVNGWAKFCASISLHRFAMPLPRARCAARAPQAVQR